MQSRSKYGNGRTSGAVRQTPGCGARTVAAQIAGRALSPPAGSQIHRPTHVAMRPLRQKSSRIRTPRHD